MTGSKVGPLEHKTLFRKLLGLAGCLFLILADLGVGSGLHFRSLAAYLVLSAILLEFVQYALDKQQRWWPRLVGGMRVLSRFGSPERLTSTVFLLLSITACLALALLPQLIVTSRPLMNLLACIGFVVGFATVETRTVTRLILVALSAALMELLLSRHSFEALFLSLFLAVNVYSYSGRNLESSVKQIDQGAEVENDHEAGVSDGSPG